MRRNILTSAFTLGFAAALVAPTAAHAQAPKADSGQQGAMMKCGAMHGKHQSGMMGRDGSSCGMMRAKRQEMDANREKMDARLAALVAKMKAAQGDRDKIAAMQAVIEELVTQRKTLADMAMSIQPMMMRHMMGHMVRGMMQGAMQGMEKCPMMQQGRPEGGRMRGMHRMHKMHGMKPTPAPSQGDGSSAGGSNP